MRIIEFYRSQFGVSPVEEFLDSLNDKQATKIAWVLRIVRDYERSLKNTLKS
jgi:hypothetical protein